MNILLLRANPRKGGYTQRVCDLVAEGASEAGAKVEDVDLVAKNITHCIGCYHCWTVTPGRCRFSDDMPGLLERMLDTDIILYATPLYYYSMSSTLKMFLERTLPLTTENFDETPQGHMRNGIRYPERWKDKKIGFITAGAFRSLDNFEALRRTFALMAEGSEAGLCASLIRPEAYLLQFELAKPKTVRMVETALKRAGVELATAGMVSEDTEQKVRLPLAVDQEHLLKYSRIYWEHAVAMGEEARDLTAVQRAVVGDVRVLMSEMARSIDPAASKKLQAVLQFDFPDKDWHFRITVDHGRCVLKEASSERCDLRVTVDTAVWAGVFTREVNVRDALMQKKIVLEGDKSLFTRLDRYFPPPVS
ncbi:MAG: hypothetical protein GF418_10045 [Chitinivibrionales bacterium]|nr:hypothetical protein [Chitinivibrionales bacterium]MBD3395953.1 hypothetical protein [Chitinivibrionales bacterium]